MYQRVMLIGRVGGDVVKRYTSQGKPVATFSLATGRSWTDKNGEKRDATVWFRINAWDKLAEICEQYVGKGSLLFVEGEVAEPKPYQAKDGTWRASLDVTARTVQFLSQREKRDEIEPISSSDEDIPF